MRRHRDRDRSEDDSKKGQRMSTGLRRIILALGVIVIISFFLPGFPAFLAGLLESAWMRWGQAPWQELSGR